MLVAPLVTAAVAEDDAAARVDRKRAEFEANPGDEAARKRLDEAVEAQTLAQRHAARVAERIDRELDNINEFVQPKILPLNPHANIPPWRSDDLDDRATKMWLKYEQDGSVNFNDFGRMLQDIAGMSDLSEREKASLWTRIANSKQQHEISLGGLRPEKRDTLFPRWSPRPRIDRIGRTLSAWFR